MKRFFKKTDSKGVWILDRKHGLARICFIDKLKFKYVQSILMDNIYCLIFYKVMYIKNNLFKKIIYSNLGSLFNNNKLFFVKCLRVKGIGYNVLYIKQHLILDLGYSYKIKIKMPKDICISVKDNNTMIIIKSDDSKVLGNILSLLLNLKKVDFYKKYGIKSELCV